MIINPSTLAFSSSMTNVLLKYSICNWMLRYDCGGAGQIFSQYLDGTDSIFDDSGNNEREDNDNNGYEDDNNNGPDHQT